MHKKGRGGRSSRAGQGSRTEVTFSSQGSDSQGRSACHHGVVNVKLMDRESVPLVTVTVHLQRGGQLRGHRGSTG